ncbi:transcription factor with AP2 domain(s) [Plasmodium gaboni]|uniref:Transcription factor with AP2 domain(S) n=1 Tax=Plasmodium gaboni TaxID=647221 RepID=A0ABY1UTD2_9APIC|nr:transcription factor with AP2 domain(s) [Plasmodium gaboni]
MFEENENEELMYFERNKESEKCQKFWESVICKGLGYTKEEIRRDVERSRREKERLLSILYGSVFTGPKYLLYSKKWRGKTLNEIINEDREKNLNKNNFRNIDLDNTYFCELSFGYMDTVEENDDKNKNQITNEIEKKNDKTHNIKKGGNTNTTQNKRKTQNGEKNTNTTNKELDEFYSKLNYLEKRSYKNRYRNENNTNKNNNNNNNNNINSSNGRSSYSNQLSNDKYNEENSDDGKVIKYKYLPTGVFYSRVSKSFIANWIDDKTKKQIKIPYKISEYGIEKCMILAILSRNLRLSNLSNVLKCYDHLTDSQKEQMLHAIRTTQKSEKLFEDIINMNGNKKNENNIINNDNNMNNNTSMNNNNNNNNNNSYVGNTNIFQYKHKNKQNTNEHKNTPIKKTLIEKKKVKQTYVNEEKLPTGVYFYQGSYVANWWETNQKKQFKVPFKISEYGIVRAKNLAIISRLIRSSSVPDINLILTQMENDHNLNDMDYTAIAELAYKYIENMARKQ